MVALNAVAGCTGVNSDRPVTSSGCVWIEWQDVAIKQDVIFRKFEDDFSIRSEEIELGMPCMFEGRVLVVAQGKGVGVPRHQVWMVTIEDDVVTIALSE
ncbi:MAG: hypothetical protein ACOY82_00770 [Pseudomonadota bacterium]